MGDPSQILKSLNEARNICLATPSIYPQVVPGVLPVVGPQQPLELRRWGADFLAETFASPVLAAEEKQKLSLGVLDILRRYVHRKEETGEEEDAAVVKSAVQCAASIYPLVFRHTLSTRDSAEVWAKMAGIKSYILRTMDSAPAGVRICGIKFIARVVQVQTPGLISDPRRPEQNEISLALLSRDHPVLQPSQLEAEASGLLDRLLGVLQDNSSDALVVTATLSALSLLVQRRPSISNKILMTVLNYNPLVLATGGLAKMGGKERVAVKSTTRTTMSFLLNVLKRNPNHPMAARLQQRTEQLRHSLTEVFSETGPGKRSAPDEPIDGLDNHKRMRTEQAIVNGTAPQQQQSQPGNVPPLPPGPVSYAQLFTLNADPSAAGFHVEAIPLHIVNQLVPPLLASIDQQRLTAAITAVQSRFLEYTKRPPGTALEAVKAVTGGEEDDDYDPEVTVGMAGAQAQVMNRMDLMLMEGQQQQQQQQDVGGPLQPFVLEAGPPLTDKEREEYSKLALTRVFGTLAELDKDVKTKGGKKVDGEMKGFNRLASAGLGQDRDGWVTLLIRLATRSTLDLANGEENSIVKQENDDRSLLKRGSGQQHFSMADGIRQTLLNYVMEDFRRRIDVAIAWLNEEWYSDRLAFLSLHPSKPAKEEAQNAETPSKPTMTDLPNYTAACLRTLDALATYLDTRDSRILIRFLSEIPQINPAVLDRVVKIADDPERVQMAAQALLYLIMFRPPVREAAVDAAERLWRGNEEARGAVGKILGRWRPGVLVDEEKG
ncbi:hypothetical protein B0A55_01110 [Friedmanniomyces simplex]|uniref:Symplekin/Pta1 N-terminal domain-containing protein n=1 Tax=Friedmanniomyces simplex TaxID=329884 RepID=A0A4U0Y2V9_9PEZI|nr:hypothetical protein B0A55_01110 [Friedmanniomyces simplex]